MAAEYLAVAAGLIDAGLFPQAQKMLEAALAVAHDAVDDLAAERGLGMLFFSQGDAEAGRQHFRQALGAFRRYPNPNQQFVASQNAFTLLNLAGGERASNHCRESAAALEEATREASKVPDIPVKGAGDLHAQIREMQAILSRPDGCGPGGATAPAFPSGPATPPPTLPQVAGLPALVAPVASAPAPRSSAH